MTPDQQRIAELEEEVRQLRAMLGLDTTKVNLLQMRLGLSPSQAILVAALYKAGGGVVSADRLDQALPKRTGHDPRSLDTIKVMVWGIRRKLGEGSILNRWGAGYALTPEGLRTCDGALFGG